ncbi:MAG: hypothetical protein ACI83Y_001053 [Candidatus Azotimanducaceae bacterium]
MDTVIVVSLEVDKTNEESTNSRGHTPAAETGVHTVDSDLEHAASDRRRFIRSVVVGGFLAFIPFILVLWDFGIAPLRTASPNGYFSNFYDLQARAFLDGRLQVPQGSLAFEAFVVGGRDYIYFPPFPSLIRLPFLWVGGTGLDGNLTAPAILIAWLITATLTAMLLWRLRSILRPNVRLGRLENWGYGAFMLMSCGGSIVTFVAALPWVYHEAYAWGIAGAIGTVYSLTGLIEQPGPRRALATGCWAMVAILSRTTSGWACAITILMVAAWFALGRRGPTARKWWWAAALAGAVPLIAGASVNYAKFRHPWLFPLDKQVWTQLSEHRRDALAANGGGLVNLRFFTTGLVNYLRPDGIRFMTIFPYITLPAEPARAYNGAFLDQTYRTGSVTSFMPGLFVLSITGIVVAFARRAEERLRWLRFPIFAALGITGGVMFYGYVAHRYTAEFFPVLVMAGGVGAVVLLGRVDAARPVLRRTVVVVSAIVVMFSVAANTAVSLQSERIEAGGTPLRNYVIVQHRLSELTGNPLDRFVKQADDLPDDAGADELHIVGDCDALYLSTGDRYQPWAPVEVRDVVLEIEAVQRLDEPTGVALRDSILLLSFDGIEDRDVVLEQVGEDLYRVVQGVGEFRSVGPEFHAPPNLQFYLTITVDTRNASYSVEGPLSTFDSVPLSSHAGDFYSLPTLVRVRDVSDGVAASSGFRVTRLVTEVPPLCADLLSAV